MNLEIQIYKITWVRHTYKLAFQNVKKYTSHLLQNYKYVIRCLVMVNPHVMLAK